MLSQMEKTLGKMIGHKGIIPGTVPVKSVEHIYFCDGTSKGDRFHDVALHSKPRHAQHGGMVGGGCHLTLPDGSIFHAVQYHGDIAGWQKDIEEGAAEQNMAIARIEDGKLAISDGRVFELSACTPVFD